MKVLAIDDQPEVLKQIERALAAAEGPNGHPYEVVGMTDHEEALERLDAEHFDVVIADMVMGAQEDEGLTVLRKLTDRSPITIVLTAYPDESDPYEKLLASLHGACQFRLEHPEAGRSNPDSTWVRQHLDELVRDHGGEVVAVLDRQVVDHDKSYGALMERMKEKFPLARPTIVSIPDMSIEAVE